MTAPTAARPRPLRAAVFASTLAALAACTDEPTGTGRSPTAPSASVAALSPRAASIAAREIAQAAGGRRQRGVEDEILQMEAAAPGVGGLYFDPAAQKFVLYLRDETDHVRALAAARDLGQRIGEHRGIPEAAGLRAGDVVIKRADFAFSHLPAWSQLLLAELANVPGFLALDADESTNRVVVTVVSPSLEPEVRRAAQAAGAPPSAVRVQIGRPIQHTYVSLRTSMRPTLNGVEIGNASGGKCSLGWNVTSTNGEEGLLTAAHCTNTEAHDGLVGAPIYQSSGGSQIGSIAIKPAWTWGCWGYVPGGYYNGYCTEADVMFVASNEGSRLVARTEDVGTNGARGTHWLSGYPWWPNTGEAVIITAAGMGVWKVGRTTGTTAGTIQATCEAVVVSASSNYLVTCADRVAASSGRGDSGSPVFRHIKVEVAPREYEWINYPVGILFANNGSTNYDEHDGSPYCQGTACQYWYSPWEKIQNRLARTFHVSGSQ